MTDEEAKTERYTIISIVCLLSVALVCITSVVMFRTWVDANKPDKIPVQSAPK